MAIDFSFPPELEMLRQKVREFIETVIRPIEDSMDESIAERTIQAFLRDGNTKAATGRLPL